uniref:Xylulose kinase-1 n=1 Tax=Tanacetum cinerariifolium TaxID=118510 RepID=A0A6L2M7B1_TANCI|nr:hypothetical protein [Tanacetum cinerariifolium]
MALTFADTHNIIVFLTKSDASAGFNQIIDFLNASSIKYALTVNPNIYVSVIKQFWTSVMVKKVNDVTRLQALVDRKKVIITEATIRYALCLDDAEGIDCLPNKEIFTELARMGYEKPSTKLTFYKAFFSSQWKFLIHTILQCMSTKRTSWNKFSSSMASTVICLSTGKGFSGVEMPLFEGMIVEDQVGEGTDEVNVKDVSAAGVASEGAASVANDDVTNAVDEPSIQSPTPPTQPPPPSQDIPSTSQRVKKLEMRNKASKLKRLKKVGTTQRIETSDDTVMDDVSKQGRIIANIDRDKDVTLKDVVVVSKDVQDAEIEESSDDVDIEPAKVQEVVEVVTTAKLITKVVIAASATITAAAPQLTTAAAPTLTTTPSTARKRKRVVIRDPEETATPSTIIHSEAKSKDKGKWILVEEPIPLKKQAQIEHDEAYARELEAEQNKTINWDDVIDYVQRKEKEDNATKEQRNKEDSRALKRLSECQEYKAAKKQKLDEEVEELRKHLQIMPNDEGDVYTEATPLALKVPVVDYEIYTENNKPYYKIKRADGSHQLYLSFLSMLRNFDREDLEVLWNLVKERFASTKPKNFLNDFLLTTLGAMFVKPDIQERKYLLTRFTMDEMLNNVRLKVEEESKVSLERLSFGVDVAKDFKEKYAK